MPEMRYSMLGHTLNSKKYFEKSVDITPIGWRETEITRIVPGEYSSCQDSVITPRWRRCLGNPRFC